MQLVTIYKNGQPVRVSPEKVKFFLKNYEDDAAVTFNETPVSGRVYRELPMFNNKAFVSETELSARATPSYQSSGTGAAIVKYDALFGIELIGPNRVG